METILFHGLWETFGKDMRGNIASSANGHHFPGITEPKEGPGGHLAVTSFSTKSLFPTQTSSTLALTTQEPATRPSLGFKTMEGKKGL